MTNIGRSLKPLTFRPSDPRIDRSLLEESTKPRVQRLVVLHDNVELHALLDLDRMLHLLVESNPFPQLSNEQRRIGFVLIVRKDQQARVEAEVAEGWRAGEGLGKELGGAAG